MLSNGAFFGTLCAVDSEPQQLTEQQSQLLVVLARLVATHIDHQREVAARAQAEAEQQRLYMAAQDALRERDALVSIASHELKNPLAIISGYAQMLQRNAAVLPAREQQMLQTIVQQTIRLNRMLEALVDISRLDNDQLTLDRFPLDLGALARRAATEFEQLLTQHILVIIDAGVPLMVNGDEDRLEQVLRNLLTNAIKYSPAGGEITLTIARESDQAVLMLQDQGIGIPQDQLPHLFERFFRAGNGIAHQIGGFGIGLYVVKEIIIRHDGVMRVDSVEGEGSTFTVSLPLLTESLP